MTTMSIVFCVQANEAEFKVYCRMVLKKFVSFITLKKAALLRAHAHTPPRARIHVILIEVSFVRSHTEERAGETLTKSNKNNDNSKENERLNETHLHRVLCDARAGDDFNRLASDCAG